jgi:splicing factor 3A subunit 1
MVQQQDGAAAGALVAVSAARTALPAAAPVETHTHTIGLIVPPPDIKAIADKTSQFVARNGA